jgi:hypothetical protein
MPEDVPMEFLGERVFFGLDVGAQFEPVEVRGGRKLESGRRP